MKEAKRSPIVSTEQLEKEIKNKNRIRKSFTNKKDLKKYIQSLDSDFQECILELTIKIKQQIKTKEPIKQINTDEKVGQGFTYKYDWYSAGRMKTDGHLYICNKCKCVGQLKYERDQCNKCSNGWGCRNSCTLSSVQCPKCHQKKKL